MKQFKKMIDRLKSVQTTSLKEPTPSAFKILATCLLSVVFLLPVAANAQSSACAANESQLTYSFAAPNNWDSGSATLKITGLPITLGAGGLW